MEQMSFITPYEKQFWKDLKSGKFARMVQKEARGQYLKSSADVFNVMKPLFAEVDDIERMFVIFMDRKNNIKAIEKVSEGTLTSSAVYPRELIKSALKYKASTVIMSHNHPSGDPTPSNEDKELTLKLAFAFRAVDITLLDHIIVGERHYSFADEGIMFKINLKFQKETTYSLMDIQ